MNTRNTRAYPEPTPICASFAAILPVLDEPATDTHAAADARAHLATCAYCQAQMADYSQLDTAMRRFLSPSGTPHPRTEDIMSQLLHDTHGDQSAPETVTPLRPIARETRPGQVRRFISGIGAFAAVLVIVTLAAALFYQHTHTTRPGIASTATPVRGSQTWLRDIAMVSSTEGWAIGDTNSATRNPNTASNQRSTALLMHYLNGVWSRVPLAIQGYLVDLSGISMLSPTDGWAVGFQEISGQPSQAIVLHYDGHTWKAIANALNGGLQHIQMLSDTDGWAIGGITMDQIVHYDGQTWTQQPLPASLGDGTQNAVALSALSMTSPTDGWAVGSMSKILTGGETTPTDPPTALILRYSGGQWTVARTIPGATLQSISMASASEGWIAGNTDTYVTQKGQPDPFDKTAPLLLHYTSGQWQPVPSPLSGGAYDVTGTFVQVKMVSPTDGWLISGTDEGAGTPHLFHYNGAQWTPASIPAIKGARFYSIASISMVSASDGWAVGSATSTEAGGIPNPQGPGYTPTVTPVILHYHNGGWSVVQS